MNRRNRHLTYRVISYRHDGTTDVLLTTVDKRTAEQLASERNHPDIVRNDSTHYLTVVHATPFR